MPPPIFHASGGQLVCAEILAAILVVEWLEVGTDQHIGIGTGVVGLPHDLAVFRIQGRDPAAHAHLASGIADQDFALHHQRRHGDGLADMDVAEFSLPDLLAGLGVNRDRVAVEGIVEEPAIGKYRAAIDHIAAGNALRRCFRLRLVLPFERRPWLGQVKRIKDVGIRRDDIHRVVHDERRGLLTLVYPDREGKRDLQLADVLRVDFVQLAIPGAGEILRRHAPLPIVWRSGGHGRDHVRADKTAMDEKQCKGCGRGNRVTLAASPSERDRPGIHASISSP